MLGAKQANRFLGILLVIAGGAGVAYAVMHFGGALWFITVMMIVALALLLWSSRR